MPAVAVVAAWAGAAATAFEAVATIAAVVTTVGAATGNKDLMMVGGIMGGIAGLVNGVGAAAAEATAAEIGATEASIAGAAQAAEAAGDATLMAGDFGVTTGMDAVSNVGNTLGTGDMVTANMASQATSVAPSVSSVSDVGTQTIASQSQGVDAVANTPEAAKTPTQANNNALAQNNAPTKAPDSVLQQSNAPTGSKSDLTFGSIGDWFKNNKDLANMGLKIVGEGLSGMTKEKELDLLKQKVDLQKQAYNDQVSNANAVPNISGMFSVNQGANVNKYLPNGQGLLYSGSR